MTVRLTHSHIHMYCICVRTYMYVHTCAVVGMTQHINAVVYFYVTLWCDPPLPLPSLHTPPSPSTTPPPPSPSATPLPPLHSTRCLCVQPGREVYSDLRLLHQDSVPSHATRPYTREWPSTPWTPSLNLRPNVHTYTRTYMLTKLTYKCVRA